MFWPALMAVLEPERGHSNQRAQMRAIDVRCRAAAPLELVQQHRATELIGFIGEIVPTLDCRRVWTLGHLTVSIPPPKMWAKISSTAWPGTPLIIEGISFSGPEHVRLLIRTRLSVPIGISTGPRIRAPRRRKIGALRMSRMVTPTTVMSSMIPPSTGLQREPAAALEDAVGDGNVPEAANPAEAG
jgi:hypothetical protein